MTQHFDIIIIGAGAAGLMAARELSANGKTCAVFEASKRIGGRIRTLTGDGFETPAEAGAEFIHGKLKHSFSLLKEAGLDHKEVEGEFIGIRKGRWRGREEHDPHWDEFMKELKRLKEDKTIQTFLEEKFGETQYVDLHAAVRRFAEGFDLADISEASMLSVKKEWEKIDDAQYRVVGGYGGILEYLVHDCKKNTTEFFLEEPVEKIRHEKGKVMLHTSRQRNFSAAKVIITASIGALRQGDLQIDPLPAPHAEAIRNIGFGSVIKILMQFEKPFWTDRSDEIGFLLTDEEFPTWWTQSPRDNALLTGWLGGPPAELISKLGNDEIRELAIQCLERLFHLQGKLKKELKQLKVFNWANEPFIRGGYSYSTLYTEAASKVLAEPFNDTVYFAGEACTGGESRGTVEAALESAKSVVSKILEG
jgi:monoamine oxidase